jgi:hypothetical protein
MTLAFRALEALGVVALFTEAAGGGDVFDPAADRNAPMASPENYLGNIKLSSALDNMEVVSDTTVTVSHGAVGGAGSVDISGGGGGVAGGGGTGSFGIVNYGAGATDTTLVTHSLGYEPDVLVVVGSQVLIPGMPVQFPAQPTGRFVSVYVTSSIVGLHEWSVVSGSGLSSVSKDYRVIVLRQPRDASGHKLIDFDASTGVLKLGYDRFSSDRRYLQVVSGGSPFRIAYGKTLDIKNGAPRFIQPDGTTFDPVPSSQVGHWVVGYAGGTYTGSNGSAMNYTGSASAPSSIMVQAP